MQAQQIADNAEPAEPGNDGSSMTANDVIADTNARSSDEDPEAIEVAEASEADKAAISKMDRFQLSKLLNADDLCVDSEESVFSCVHYWLQQR